MNIRDTLLAYIDGTLSPAAKRQVSQKLANSVRWQTEYDSLKNVRWQLTNEMPLMGSPLDGQMASLLPHILQETQSSFNGRWFIRQAFMFGTVGLTILLLTVGFVQLTSSAHAAVNILGNIPSITNTPASADSTVEAKIRYVPVRDIEVGNPNLLISGVASPVPMPLATMEPSLVAGGHSAPH